MDTFDPEIAAGSSGHVWLRTGLFYRPDPLARFDGASWHIVTPPVPTVRSVQSLLVADDGIPWVGTNGDGLFGFDGQRWIHLEVDSPWDNILAEEYNVFNGLIQAADNHPVIYSFGPEHISCQTLTNLDVDMPESLEGRVEGALWQDYILRNVRSYPIDRLCNPNENGLEEEYFKEVTLSRPGFNAERDRALVYIHYLVQSSGPLEDGVIMLDRRDHFVRLSRTGDKWIVTEAIPDW